MGRNVIGYESVVLRHESTKWTHEDLFSLLFCLVFIYIAEDLEAELRSSRESMPFPKKKQLFFCAHLRIRINKSRNAPGIGVHGLIKQPGVGTSS